MKSHFWTRKRKAELSSRWPSLCSLLFLDETPDAPSMRIAAAAELAEILQASSAAYKGLLGKGPLSNQKAIERHRMQRIADAAGCPDEESFTKLVARIRVQHAAIVSSHRAVKQSRGSADICGDCGADIEDALQDGFVCPGANRKAHP